MQSYRVRHLFVLVPKFRNHIIPMRKLEGTNETLVKNRPLPEAPFQHDLEKKAVSKIVQLHHEIQRHFKNHLFHNGFFTTHTSQYKSLEKICQEKIN